MRHLKRAGLPAAVLLALLSGNVGHAAEIGQFNAGERFSLPVNESYHGDLYVFAGDTNISGKLHGDLLASSGQVRIAGDVDGDVIVFAGSLDISGNVGDTVRFFGSNISIHGTIDGDVIAFGAMVTVFEGAHITGNLIGCMALLEMHGTVDGDLQFKGGEAMIDGTVHGNVRVEADAVALLSEAEILGDFTYASRKELEMEEGATVRGETIILESHREDGEEASRSFSVGWWIWKTLSTAVVGLVLIALFRRIVPLVTETVSTQAVMGTVLGFGAFLVVPVAAGLAMVLIIGIPLGLLALILYVVALYLAQIPVAVWLGRRLLSLVGGTDPSPYLGIALGVPLLNLLYLIPWLGSLAWLVATWLGLGATILATRNYVQNRNTQPAT